MSSVNETEGSKSTLSMSASSNDLTTTGTENNRKINVKSSPSASLLFSNSMTTVNTEAIQTTTTTSNAADIIEIEEFQLETIENLFKFKNENLFTDVHIYVEGVEFPCHKVILCAASSYFKAMFSCDLKESRHGKVYIENISPWTMKRLLDFIYTGKIEINYENVIDLFNAAVLFQLYKLVDKCTNYIQANIDLNNCVEINLFSSMHQLTTLENYSFKFILENFMPLINLTLNSTNTTGLNTTTSLMNVLFNTNTNINKPSVERPNLDSLSTTPVDNDDNLYSNFVRLNEKTFTELLKSDLLNVTREIYVYYALNKWLEHYLMTNANSQNAIKLNNRSILALHESLFKYLRLNAFSHDELEYILHNDKYVKMNTNLHGQIRKHMEVSNFGMGVVNLDLNKTGIEATTSGSNELERKIKDKQPSLLEQTDLQSAGSCNNISPTPTLIASNSDDKLNAATRVNNAGNADANTNIRPSTIPRDHLCYLSLDEFYLYDFYKSKWDVLPSWCQLTKHRLNGYSTSTINNMLYVLGGYGVDNKHSLDTCLDLNDVVYRFDPIKNEWSTCRSMLRKRAFHSSYVLSASTSTSNSTTINKSSHKNGRSTTNNNMYYIFVFYGICYRNEFTNDASMQTQYFDDRLQVTQCLSIDFYNLQTDQWSELKLNNSLLNHHIFHSFYQYNRTLQMHHENVAEGSVQATNTSSITEMLINLINLQLNQSKSIVSLKNLFYILHENCIHCYQFDASRQELVCLPYFRLPINLSNFILAGAVSTNIKTNGDSSVNGECMSLFSWLSDNDDSPMYNQQFFFQHQLQLQQQHLQHQQQLQQQQQQQQHAAQSSSLSSSSISSSTSSNLNDSPTVSSSANESDFNQYDSIDHLGDELDKRLVLKQEKEAIIYLINPRKKLFYEFYPAKNKFKKLTSLIYEHDASEVTILNLNSKLFITGGYSHESINSAIEAYDATVNSCSVFQTHVQNTLQSEARLPTIKKFFKLRISLV